jgi:cytosine deaminase
MCSGTAILFKIPRVVIGEKPHLHRRGGLDAREWRRDLLVVDDARCIALMERMQREKPDLWAEDIGE